MTSTPKYKNEWHQYRKYTPVDLHLIKKDQIYMYVGGDGIRSGIVTIRSIVNGVIDLYYNDSIGSDTINIENPGEKKLYEPVPIEVGGKRTRRSRKSRKVKKLRRKRTRRN
jgi:hypothetical protein